MKRNRTIGGVVLVLMVAASTSACTGNDPPDPPSTTTASPTTTTPSPEDQAIAEATPVVHDYYRVMDELASDPTMDLARLEEVTISAGLGEAKTEIVFGRSKGYRSVGTTELVSVNPTDVTLEFKPNDQPPDIPTVSFDVCYDVSGVDVVDATGKSVVLPERPEQALTRLAVSNYDWPAPEGWKVSGIEVKGEQC